MSALAISEFSAAMPDEPTKRDTSAAASASIATVAIAIAEPAQQMRKRGDFGDVQRAGQPGWLFRILMPWAIPLFVKDD
jgi:hypothetical protein